MAAGKEYDHVPTSPDYPRGGRSEMDWDLGGWSRGMTWPASNMLIVILQVCWHCLSGRENCFKHSDRLARHVCEDFHPQSVGLLVTPELLCNLNEPYAKLRAAFFF